MKVRKENKYTNGKNNFAHSENERKQRKCMNGNTKQLIDEHNSVHL